METQTSSTQKPLRVMVVGRFPVGALDESYARAFTELGHQVQRFDLQAADLSYCRFGRLGRMLHTYLPVEAWNRKANRDMVVEARRFAPDLVLTIGQNPVAAGALAQLKASTGALLAWVWQDSMVSLNPRLIAVLPLYDLAAAYAASSVDVLRRLGALRVEWVPLAADPHLHNPSGDPDDADTGLAADVTFIGQWRPERQAAVEAILAGVPGLAVKVWGPDWGRRGSAAVKAVWQGRSLYASEFARAVRASKVNLNIIDDTNYPAANMRFFEIPCAGGAQVSSACPEMEDVFREGEDVFYYRGVEQLPGIVRRLIERDDLRREVARKGHARVLAGHTYEHRVQQMLSYLMGSIITAKQQD